MNPREAPSSSFSPPPSPETENSAAAAEEEEEEVVMSEVHLGCPPNYSGPHFSRFTFSLSPEVEAMDSKCLEEMNDEPSSIHQVVSVDEDGDLLVTRRSKRCQDNYVVIIKHNITTSIPSVGLQIWRAELVLADFVLHKMTNSSDIRGVIAVELGAGTGLVGMLLAHDAKTVFLTDHGDEILDNCIENVHLNSKLWGPQSAVHVRELDWKDPWPPKVLENSAFRQRYDWSIAELEELQKATLIVAADVIYSDDLTDAFFNTLERLAMQGPEKVVYLALEKRYNFSLDDLNVVANGYSRFRSYLKVDGDCDYLNITVKPCFVGKCLDLAQIPQYMREYDRGNDVEIWQIKYEKLNE